MSEHVSSFDRVSIGDFEYLFFVITWNDYQTSVTEEIEKQVEAFGEDLNVKGKVVRAFKSATYKTAAEIINKKWPNEILKRFENEQDPIMLIIDTGFHEFNPELHSWSIIWFSDFFNQPEKIYKIFGQIARKTKKGESIFDFFKLIAIKDTAKKWARCFEYKPTIFGISIDVKAVFENFFKE